MAAVLQSGILQNCNTASVFVTINYIRSCVTVHKSLGVYWQYSCQRLELYHYVP